MDFEWAQKLNRFSAFAERIVLLLGLLLAAAVVFVTGNTIRLQILTQKDEIEVSQLIGATRRFIRRPFLYFGATQGLLAGLVAVLAVLIFTWWAGAEVHLLFVQGAEGYDLIEVDGPPPAEGATVELPHRPAQFVTRVGRAPVPGGALPCAYLVSK